MIEIRHKDTGAVLLQLTAISLHSADMQGADLRNADLRGENLTGADLQGTDLRGAGLTGCCLNFGCYDEQTRWPDGFRPDGLFMERLGWVLPDSPATLATVDETRAIEIARQAVVVNDSWTDGDIGRCERDGDVWRVSIWLFERN